MHPHTRTSPTRKHEVQDRCLKIWTMELTISFWFLSHPLILWILCVQSFPALLKKVAEKNPALLREHLLMLVRQVDFFRHLSSGVS